VTNLTADRDLTARDVQELASSDAVAAFFSGLGYDTAARVLQTATAMGVTAESLQRKIRRIERVASQDGGALEVYLIELDSVTVAVTQGLARALRDRAGDYLLVLTDDYESIDVVLLERERPVRPSTGLATPRVTIRSRTLSVARRDPSPVALRVLRRFSYTEGDAFAQFDKLRSAYSVAEWSEPLFNNRALFSDYFLNARLPGLPEWSEDAKPVYRQLVDLYGRARDRLAGADEATVRRELIEPALEALGFAVTAGPSADRAPDYLLATNPKGKDPVACLAYTWDRALDGRDEARDTSRSGDNPGARVVSVLEAGAAPWALVTNGKLWRLYAAAAASRATSYYELDLEETLAAVDPNDAFRYFWLFFRAAAFQPREVLVGGEWREISFLDRLLLESADYARRLGERLKERVFDEVFPELGICLS